MSKQKLKDILFIIFDKFFPKVFSSWFFSSGVLLLLNKDELTLENVQKTSPALFILAAVVFYTVSTALDCFIKGSPYVILGISFLFFSCVLAGRENNVYTYLALALFTFVIIKYINDKKSEIDISLPKKAYVVLIAALVLGFFSIALITSLYRYLCYGAPNFDFGIFANMYYNMRQTLKPVTTCERDKLMSHFSVHISPALYVFLPIYFVFPSPVTVVVCQIVAVYSGIIPFMLMAKRKKISYNNLLFLSVIYSCSPVLISGTLFDFHENCLLVPFLMWMFYFYEKKKTIPMFIFALLTLLVKEDAFVYVAVFALFLIFTNRKNLLKGLGLAVMSVGYFVLAVFLLKKFGTGIMSYRFDSMIPKGEGLLSIIKTVLLGLGYSIKQLFTTSDNSPDKLFYFVKLFFPLAFLPFMTKKYSKLLLTLPILLNLFTNYAYQYDISFQYSFGIITMLLYLSLINLTEKPAKKRVFRSSLAASLSVILFFMLIFPRFVGFNKDYRDNKETYNKMDAVLEAVPSDKSVAATAFLLPKLSERDVIYETFYHKVCDVDYAIFDIRPGYKEESLEQAKMYAEAGYSLAYYEEGAVMIYESPEEAKQN